MPSGYDGADSPINNDAPMTTVPGSLRARVPEDRQTEISRAFNDLTHKIDRFGDRVSALEERLKVVLNGRPVPSSPSKEVEEASSPMGKGLRGLCAVMDKNVERLEQIIAQIEL